VTECAVCGQAITSAASEYGDRERPCDLACWLVYLHWQGRVNAAADEACARLMREPDIDETPAQVLTTAGYLMWVEPDDVEADVLEEYGVLPGHIEPRRSPPPDMARLLWAAARPLQENA
jgi:hypothetical protein